MNRFFIGIVLSNSTVMVQEVSLTKALCELHFKIYYLLFLN